MKKKAIENNIANNIDIYRSKLRPISSKDKISYKVLKSITGTEPFLKGDYSCTENGFYAVWQRDYDKRQREIVNNTSVVKVYFDDMTDIIDPNSNAGYMNKHDKLS